MATGGFNVFGPVYVDGVEIKLSERLSLPPKVTLPANFQMGNPTEVLFMEYDFSLEEGVLSWCEKQKKAVAERQKAIEEEAARQAALKAAEEEEKEKARKLAEEEAEKARQAEEEKAAALARAKSEEDEAKVNDDTATTDENTADMHQVHPQNTSDEHEQDSPQTEASLSPQPTSGPIAHASPEAVTPAANEDIAPQAQEAVTYPIQSQNDMTSQNEMTSPSQAAAAEIAPQTGQSQPSLNNQSQSSVMYGSVGGILLPQPAQPTVRQMSMASNASSAFDPKDFENNELDPFETVELKTIDDMAELNKVLQGVNISQQNTQQVPQQQQNAQVSQQNTQVNQQNTHVTQHSQMAFSNSPQQYSHTAQPTHQLPNSTQRQQPYVNTSYAPPNVATNSQTGVGINSNSGTVIYNPYNAQTQNAVAASTSVVPPSSYAQTASVKNIGYPNINLSSNYSSSPQGGAVSFCKNSSSISFQKQSYPAAATNVSYPNTNPFVPSNAGSNYTQSGSGGVYNNTNAYGRPNGGSQWPSNQGGSTNPFSLDRNHQYPSASISSQASATHVTSTTANLNNSSNVGVTGPVSNQTTGQIAMRQNWVTFGQESWQPNHLSSAVPKNGERWQEFYQKTSPESSSAQYASGFEKLKDNGGSKSQSHSRSNTPISLNSMQELRGSKSTPDLAAIAGGAEASFQTTPPKDASSSHTENSPKNLASQQPLAKSNVDPYRTMSGECQRFVNRIADMGFLRTRVAIAVQKLGQNDKKVLDYLCGVNRLSEKGFSIDNSEMALTSCNGDETRALKFLTLQKRYKEFGFSESKIHEGLLKNDLDEEKTLDWLTSTNC